MNSISELKRAVSEKVPRGKMRCFFVKDDANGINSIEDLADVSSSVANNQRIYFTTHSFPKSIDVSEWTDDYIDNNGLSVKFVKQAIQPVIYTYGYLYIEEKFVETKSDEYCQIL